MLINKYVDIVINVAEPSVDSIELSIKIVSLSKSLGLKHVFNIN